MLCVTEDGEVLNAAEAVFKEEDLFLGVGNEEQSIALSPVEVVLGHNADGYHSEMVSEVGEMSSSDHMNLFSNSSHNLLHHQDGSQPAMLEANNNHYKNSQQLLVITHEDPETVADRQMEDSSLPDQRLLVWATDQAVEEEVYVVDEGSGSVTLEMLHRTDDQSQLDFVQGNEQFIHMLDSSSYPKNPSGHGSSSATPAVSCPEPAATSTRAAPSGKGNAKPRKPAAARLFKCDYCGKCFSTNYSLSCHTRIHTKEAPYHCPIEGCSKKFKINGDLAKHIRSHTGERPFVCEICNRGFTTGNILKVHVRVHTGERPYACKEANCGKRFSSITNYNNHMRIHRGEKPYACAHEGCGRRFTEYSSLYKHRLVHDDSKKFQCPICNKSYRQSTSFQHHLNSVHGGVPCARCGLECRCGPPVILPATASGGRDDNPTHFILDPGQEWQEVKMEASEDGTSVGPVMRLLQVAGEGGERQLLLLTRADTTVQTQ